MAKINYWCFIVSFLAICLLCIWHPSDCRAKAESLSYSKRSGQIRNFSPVPKKRKWGFGLIIGDPTGVTAKYWQDEHVAYEFALGSQLASAGVGVHADYLYHLFVFEDAPEAPVYIGGGAFLGGSSDMITTGGRGVIGLTYLFEQPFDVFMQLSPSISLLPELEFYFSFSIGARLYI